MCLTLNEKIPASTSNKNQRVFKYLTRDGRTPCRYYKYNRFKRYINEVPLQYSETNWIYIRRYSITYGFHSYPFTELDKYEWSSEDFLKHIFVIPKNTKYVEGFDNDTDNRALVSRSIIWIGRNTWYNRLICRLFYKC